jgi:hypothetical protein
MIVTGDEAVAEVPPLAASGRPSLPSPREASHAFFFSHLSAPFEAMTTTLQRLALLDVIHAFAVAAANKISVVKIFMVSMKEVKHANFLMGYSESS